MNYDSEQQNRMNRAKYEPMRILDLDKKHKTCVVENSTHDSFYSVTMYSCTCPDFQKRFLPCKHMYKLCYALGEPVSSLSANTSKPQKEKKITAKAVIPDPPTAGVAVLGSLIIVAGFFLSGSSIPAGIIVALFGAYCIYAYIAHKRNPDSGKYISEGQLTRWRQLLSVSSGTSSELVEKSLPVLLELKAAAEEYCSQLPESAEALLNTQQKIVDFSEFVIIKGDNPKKDYERYSALISESQK